MRDIERLDKRDFERFRFIIVWMLGFVFLFDINKYGLFVPGSHTWPNVGVGGWILSVISPVILMFLYAIQKDEDDIPYDPTYAPPDISMSPRFKFWVWVAMISVFLVNAGPFVYLILGGLGAGEWTDEYRLAARWQAPLVTILISFFISFRWNRDERARKLKAEVDGPYE